MACGTCHDLDTAYWSRISAAWLGNDKSKYATYEDIQRTAKKGCAICYVLVEGIQRFIQAVAEKSKIFFKIQPPQPLSITITSPNFNSIFLEFYTLEGKIAFPFFIALI
jgi:hypothetical protein